VFRPLPVTLPYSTEFMTLNPAASQAPTASELPDETQPSFGDLLSQYEKSHVTKNDTGNRQLVGTVISLSADSVFLDIGFKCEGILPLTAFQSPAQTPKPGQQLPVSVKGRDPEGYYQLTLGKVERPADWTALEKAFTEKSTVVGTVTGVIKGGLTVDIGVRAFMPASRSGTREATDMEKLVGQEILCRIIKLDVTDEDVVVDRRAVLEEEERSAADRRLSEIKEGSVLAGTVRSLADYGAFVDIGGVDALLHVSDIAWTRINKAADLLSVGQQIEVKVLKITTDSGKRRISVGMKQAQPDPWESVAGKYHLSERVRGTITRVADFGAFVELEPGVEGLIHVSEMSWGRKLRSAGTLVKPGDVVDAVILGLNLAERRISLGLKQALGDPWNDAAKRFPAGTVIEGPVVSLTKFGAFVQLDEGVEGMIHVSDLSSEKRINHPQEMLKVGQIVKAQVLAIDTEKRQLRLGIKQLAPTGLDDYVVEHKPGDLVSGRIVEVSDDHARVELGEGIVAIYRTNTAGSVNSAVKEMPAASPARTEKLDLSSLGSMLQARWKSGSTAAGTRQEPLQAGQVRKFRITSLNPASKKIELELE
jgi:small subunit ribosomal protein S1